MQWRLLPLSIHAEADYEPQFEDARSRPAKREPDDAHALALATALELPLRSNDKDIDGHGVTRLTTAKLLAILGRSTPAKR